MESTVKMIFSEDMAYNFNPAHFTKDVVYNIPMGDVGRWLKRGGKIVNEVSAAVVTPAVESQTIIEEDLPEEESEEVLDDESDEDDGAYF